MTTSEKVEKVKEIIHVRFRGIDDFLLDEVAQVIVEALEEEPKQDMPGIKQLTYAEPHSRVIDKINELVKICDDLLLKERKQ